MSIIKEDYGKGVESCLSWRKGHNGQIPPKAISAGSEVYVARGFHQGEAVPGKFVTGHDKAYIPYDGREISVSEYEVLVDTSLDYLSEDTFEWKHASNGKVPKYALVGGTDNGKPLYVARSKVDGEDVCGKVFPQLGNAYFPHGGKEHEKHEYEVLCFIKRSR